MQIFPTSRLATLGFRADHHEAKPAPPAFPNAENYKRARALLAQLNEALGQTGDLTDDQREAARALGDELRKEIAAAFGKAQVTLSDLEKKDITWRQHEELARGLFHCAETPGPKQIKRKLFRRVVEYGVGAVCTGVLAVGAMFIAWYAVVPDWTFTPGVLQIPLQSEGFAVAIGFGMMAGILAPFAAFAAYRVVTVGRQLLALGGFNRAASLRRLEMEPAGKGRRRAA